MSDAEYLQLSVAPDADVVKRGQSVEQPS